MSIDLLGRATTIHMIGESHTIQFSDLLFKPGWANDLYQCRTLFFHHLPASYYLEDGDYNPLLRAALIGAGILDSEGNADYLARDWTADHYAGRPVLAPPMVFFAGDVDMQTVTFQTGDRYDFELPNDPGYGVDFDKEPMDYQSVRRRIERLFAPFFTVLQSLGPLFPRTMVHALAPRTRDDQRSARWTGGVFPAAVRSKLIVVANHVLAEGCTAAGVPFIDTSAQVSLDGYLNPAFDLDGLHLNRSAAEISLDAIAGVLYDQTATTWNSSRYVQLRTRSLPFAGPTDVDPSWQTHGWTVGDLGGAGIALGDGLDFVDNPIHPDANPDWVCYPRAGRRDIAMAEPSAAQLEAAARLFCVGPPRARLQAGECVELTIVSYRPIRLNPGASADAGALPTPYGCRRAILCLDGAGSVVREALTGEVLEDQPARPGLFVVYDPNRVRCRAVAKGEAERFVEICLAPRFVGHPFRVVSAGLKDWPADPFCYRLDGVRAFPPIEGRQVREWCYPVPAVSTTAVS